MYNPYISPEIAYEPIQPVQFSNGQEKSNSPWWKDLLSAGGKLPWRELLRQDGGDPLDSLLKSLKLDGVDSGDILLILLILFLLIEGEDQWELIITLGLLLIMGLAEGEEKAGDD